MSATRRRKGTPSRAGAGSEPKIKRPAARRRAANGKTSAHLGWLRRAEAVIVNGLKIALALEYQPGGTPVVLGRERGRTAEDLVWAAQALNIPIIELIQLNPSDISSFVVGQEIPEAWYRPIAHAFAMLYKSVPSPELVRFIRPVASKRRQAPTDRSEFDNILNTPPVVIEIGTDLAKHSADFEEPIHQTRQRIALEMGLLLAPIPMRPTPQLPVNGYVIRFRDVPLHDGQIDFPIDSTEKQYALGNRVKHLLYRHGWELLGYQEVETQVELVRKSNPGLVRALFPQNFSISAIRQVLRNLLREQLSIRDLTTILEVVLENLPHAQEPDLLTECVRIAYSRSLCHKYRDTEGYLNVLTLHPSVERVLREALKDSSGVLWMDLSPDSALRVLGAIDAALKQGSRLSVHPVILASPALRRYLARLVEDIFQDLAVLSYSEIAPLTEVRAVGTVQF